MAVPRWALLLHHHLRQQEHQQLGLPRMRRRQVLFYMGKLERRGGELGGT